MRYKIHDTKNGQVLACCDKELVGKVLEQGEIYFNISKSFYDDKKTDEKTLIELIKTSENINLVGKKSVAAALKAKYIDENSIKYIKKIPHVQIYRI